ncbi:MAG: Rne/Rng family ribonuclease [Rhodothermales bacterium]
MQKEIIINAEKNQTRIALIENGELVELYIEDPENERTLGDIYLGRVRRTMSSIQAAFIDIGQKQDAFLHFSDLADNLPEWLELLEQESPSVQKSVDSGARSANSRLAQRRRPRGQKSGSDRDDDELEVTDLDDVEDEPEDEPREGDSRAEGDDGDDGADSDKPRSRAGNRSRGRRRSAQQRSRSRSEDQEQPRGRRRDNRPPREESPEDMPADAAVAEAPETPADSPELPVALDGVPDAADVVEPVDAVEEAEEVEVEREERKAPREPREAREPREQRGRNQRGPREDRQSAEKRVLSPEAYLKRDRPILVKIVKEPISAKGSRVSTDISLAGRFLVLVPLANYVAVSKKIYSYKERRRLRALAKSLLPEGFGVIVRTVAEGKKAKELDTDLRLLLDKWRKIEKKLQGSPRPPLVVHEDVNMASSVIRDLFSDDYDRILIDEPKLFRNVKNYVQAIAPHMVPAVQQHKGKKHIFQEARIAREVQQAFESRVDLPSGGYLFIEHTEAMHVVDVNSGRAGRGLSQEDNSLKVDLEAVQVIARQVRLRDLGGIIVVDFIDLRLDKNRKKVYNELRKAFRKDRAVTKVLPMSDFGLIEITRQRLRPSITKTFAPSAGAVVMVGEADVTPAPPGAAPDAVSIEAAPVVEREDPIPMDVQTFLDKVERWIQKYKEKKEGRTVHLLVHPFTEAYLTRHLLSIRRRWFFKYGISVHVRGDEKMAPFRYRFLDPRTGKPFRNDRRRGKKNRVEEAKPAVVD